MSSNNSSNPSSSSSSFSSSSSSPLSSPPSSLPPSSPRPLSSFAKLSKSEEWEAKCIADNSYQSLLGWRFTIAGLVVGMTISAFLPPNIPKLKRLAPFFGLGVGGILMDDYFVRQRCRQLKEEFFRNRPMDNIRPEPPAVNPAWKQPKKQD